MPQMSWFLQFHVLLDLNMFAHNMCNVTFSWYLCHIGSLWPSHTIWLQGTCTLLVWIMAYCLFITKSFPEAMLMLFQLDSQEQYFIKAEWRIYMLQYNIPALVQIMACCLSGTKPLSEPMSPYCQLDPKEHISVKYYLKFKFFHSKKCTWKCLLWNGCHFVSVSTC